MAKLPIKNLTNLFNTMKQCSSFKSTTTRSISSTFINLQVDRTSNKRNKQATATATTQVIPPPVLDGQEKNYSQKVQSLVSEISKLTLVEVADLNELLRKTLKIKDTPMYAAAPVAAAADKSAAKEEKDEPEQMQVSQKSSFKLKIVKYDETRKVALIKEVKSLTENMNLVQAKKFIETLPQVFRDNVGKDEAEKVKAQLEKAGAVCEIE